MSIHALYAHSLKTRQSVSYTRSPTMIKCRHGPDSRRWCFPNLGIPTPSYQPACMGPIPVALDTCMVTYSTAIVHVQRQQCTFSHNFICPSGDSNTSKSPQATSTPQRAESSDSGYSSAQESKLLLNEVQREYPSTTKCALSCEYSTWVRTNLQIVCTGMNLSVLTPSWSSYAIFQTVTMLCGTSYV